MGKPVAFQLSPTQCTTSRDRVNGQEENKYVERDRADVSGGFDMGLPTCVAVLQVQAVDWLAILIALTISFGMTVFRALGSAVC